MRTVPSVIELGQEHWDRRNVIVEDRKNGCYVCLVMVQLTHMTIKMIATRKEKKESSCNPKTHIFLLHTFQVSRADIHGGIPEDWIRKRQVKKWLIFQHLYLLLFNGVDFKLTLAQHKCLRGKAGGEEDKVRNG